MSDDLANTWGTNLVNMISSDEHHDDVSSNLLEFEQFKRIVSHHFSDEFLLHKICLDGSSANLLAIIDGTFGNTSSCDIACGSYLSAHDTVLQNLSISEFYLEASFSIIRLPDESDSHLTRHQVIALPYHIEGTINTSELEK